MRLRVRREFFKSTITAILATLVSFSNRLVSGQLGRETTTCFAATAKHSQAGEQHNPGSSNEGVGGYPP